MKRVCHIMLIILFFALNSYAQDSKSGAVVVHTDPRLSVLLNKKKVVMQASSVRPVHHTTETHIASSPRIAANITPPVTSAASKSAPPPVVASATAPEAKPTKVETSHAVPAKAPVYIREREGRVIYSGKGYRVQIYNGSDRERAIMIKTEFMRHFPGVRTYLTYVSPCFRVKVGNFRNRSDALGMYKEAKEMYSPCVIVPDIITINTF